ncbi:MAG: hypothetical protein RL693_571 [Verrucomicrobiota bacterium]|jgi:methyltransferase (TIGR00027 family)
MISQGMGELEVRELREGGVGQTCLLIAAWRAKEAEQIDPLFVDPMANIFISPAMESWVDQVTRASVSTFHLISCRTRYFDDCLKSEMERGLKQVVLLGAGLDTRSLRLGNPAVSFYEIDQGEVLLYKRQCLEGNGYSVRSHLIEGDYIQDDLLAMLESRGFRANEETYFIWEGNTMYIPGNAILSFLNRLKAGVPRFRISFDYLSEQLIQQNTGFEGAVNLINGFAEMGAPWVTGFADIQQVAVPTSLTVLENKWVAEVVEPSHLRETLSRDLFRHYSVCTLSSCE